MFLLVLSTNIFHYAPPIIGLFTFSLYQNFAVNIAEAQLNPELTGPDGTKTTTALYFERMDFFFTCFFVAELLVNLYANWLGRFLRNGYNIVDAAVIVLSVATLAGTSFLHMSVVRTLRAFRAVRLFGKFRRVPRLRDT
jgi:hypothetical protein